MPNVCIPPALYSSLRDFAIETKTTPARAAETAIGEWLNRQRLAALERIRTRARERAIASQAKSPRMAPLSAGSMEEITDDEFHSVCTMLRNGGLIRLPEGKLA